MRYLSGTLKTYCKEHGDEIYKAATKDHAYYHGSDEHLHKSKADEVTRFFDTDGKGTIFDSKMTDEELCANTMSIITDHMDEIIEWRVMNYTSDEPMKRLKLIDAVSADMERFPDGVIGTGLSVGYSGKDKRHYIENFETNAQAVILEPTTKGDANHTILGFRIITEYPVITPKRTLEKWQSLKDHTDDSREDGHIQEVHIGDLENICQRRKNRSVDPKDVSDGIKNSRRYKELQKQYENAQGSEGRKDVDDVYFGIVDHMGMEQAAPFLDGNDGVMPSDTSEWDRVYKKKDSGMEF